MPIDAKEAFSRVQIFRKMSPASLAALASCGSLRRFPKGKHLFLDKQMNSTLYFVVDGFVSLYKVNAQGERKTIFLMGRGELINEEALQVLPTSINCEAFENVQALCFNQTDFLRVMQQDFALTKAVFDSLLLKNRRLYRQLKNTSNTVRGDKRIAAKLWKLSMDYGVPREGGTCIIMDLSITYLADMLGSKRETVSRQLKSLTEQGLVQMRNGKIVIPDRDALVAFFKSP